MYRASQKPLSASEVSAWRDVIMDVEVWGSCVVVVVLFPTEASHAPAPIASSVLERRRAIMDTALSSGESSVSSGRSSADVDGMKSY